MVEPWRGYGGVGMDQQDCDRVMVWIDESCAFK